jgi:hypothetical protein
MSGAAIVPLGIAAYFVKADSAKTGLELTAIFCLAAAVYRLWSAERQRNFVLEERLKILGQARPVLELLFDENDSLRYDPTEPPTIKRLRPAK